MAEREKERERGVENQRERGVKIYRERVSEKESPIQSEIERGKETWN